MPRRRRGRTSSERAPRTEPFYTAGVRPRLGLSPCSCRVMAPGSNDLWAGIMASRSTPRICPSERVALPIRAGTVELVIAESRLPPRPPFAPQWYRYGPHELSEGDAIERLERFGDDLA